MSFLVNPLNDTFGAQLKCEWCPRGWVISPPGTGDEEGAGAPSYFQARGNEAETSLS